MFRLTPRFTFALPLVALSSLLLMTSPTAAQADFIQLQLNSSNDFGAGYGYSDTIGGNAISNAYLSMNGGTTFINYADGPTTSIRLPTTTLGTFTYQFYYTNAFANALTLQLWSRDRTVHLPDIVVSTQRDKPASAFAPVFDPSTAPPFAYPNGTPPGSKQAVIGDRLVTLTGFAFTNGAGPALAFSVEPGTLHTPEIYGEFTYEVSELVPEASALASGLLPVVLVLLLRRRKSPRATTET